MVCTGVLGGCMEKSKKREKNNRNQNGGHPATSRGHDPLDTGKIKKNKKNKFW
jgi:hypothetical protein